VILIPVVALIVGVIIGLLVKVDTYGWSVYMGVAVIAGIDSVCGGSRSALEGKFRTDVFVTGFIANILLSVGLIWLGDRVGVSFILVVAIVLGMRIFTNLSVMRRMALTMINDARQRRARRKEELAAQPPNA
jgi:small basic protein